MLTDRLRLIMVSMTMIFVTIAGRADNRPCAGELVSPPKRGTDWSRVDFADIFAQMESAGISLQVNSLRRDSEGAVARLLAEHGLNIKGSSFVQKGLDLYGSWPQALRINGIDPEKYDRRPERKLEPAEILRVLSALHNAGVPLNYASLVQHDQPGRSIIKQTLNVDLSPRALYHRVQENPPFRGWNKALLAAGLPAEDIILVSHDTWTREEILEVVRFVHELYGTLNLTFLRSEADTIRRRTFERFGRKISPLRLAEVARLEFGTWIKTVEAAGLPTDGVGWSSRGPRSPKFVREALKMLAKELPSMQFDYLEKNGPAIARLTYQKLGVAVGPQSLMLAVRRIHGSWARALLDAGVTIENVRVQNPGVVWSEDLLHDVLRHFRSHRMNLTLPRFLSQAGRVKVLTLKQYHRAFSPYVIYNAALDLHGGWCLALEAAGVEATSSRRSKITSDIVLMPHVVMYEQDNHGNVRRVVEYGHAGLNPEEALIESELNEHVRETVSHLNAAGNAPALLLLEYLEERDGLDDHGHVLSFLHARTGREWHWGEVQQVLENLASGLQRDLID